MLFVSMMISRNPADTPRDAFGSSRNPADTPRDAFGSSRNPADTPRDAFGSSHRGGARVLNSLLLRILR